MEKKTQLEALEKPTAAQKNELTGVSASIALIDEAMDKLMLEGEAPAGKAESKPEATDYVPAEGTEDMVHLKVANGRRFDPATGKELSKPFTQMFTASEWRVFKEHHKRIGLHIIEVLHDPLGEAHNYVTE